MNIFYEIDEKDKSAMLKCLRAVKKTFLKDEIIFDETKTITSVCYVEQGKVRMMKDDYDGNKVIIADFVKGEVFGEAIVSQGGKQIGVNIIALEDTEILFMDFKRVLSVCQNSCPFHRKLIENFVKNLAEKNILLQEKIELLSKKSLRARILKFLYSIKKEKKQVIFEIPYSREQMADVICADRSALSRELSNMKKENIIDYNKNSFKFVNLK